MSDDYETITRIVKANRTKTTFKVEVEHEGDQLTFGQLFCSNGHKTTYTSSIEKSKTEEIDVEIEETRSVAHKKVENKIAKKIVFDTFKKAGYPRLKTNQTTPDEGKYCRISCIWAKSWKNRDSDCVFDIILHQEPRTKHHTASRFRILSEDGSFKIIWDFGSFAANYSWVNRKEFIYTKIIPFADPNLDGILETEINKLSKAMMHADTCWQQRAQGTSLELGYGRAELDNHQFAKLKEILNEPNDKNGAGNSS